MLRLHNAYVAKIDLEPTLGLVIFTFSIDLGMSLCIYQIQMRTGRIRLRAFLFERRVPDVMTPVCACGDGREKARHEAAVRDPTYQGSLPHSMVHAEAAARRIQGGTANCRQRGTVSSTTGQKIWSNDQYVDA